MTRGDWPPAYDFATGRSLRAVLLRTAMAGAGLALMLIPWSAIAFGLKTAVDQCAFGGIDAPGCDPTTKLLADLYYPLTLVTLTVVLAWVLSGGRRSAAVSATAVLAFLAYSAFSLWVA